MCFLSFFREAFPQPDTDPFEPEHNAVDVLPFVQPVTVTAKPDDAFELVDALRELIAAVEGHDMTASEVGALNHARYVLAKHTNQFPF